MQNAINKKEATTEEKFRGILNNPVYNVCLNIIFSVLMLALVIGLFLYGAEVAKHPCKVCMEKGWGCFIELVVGYRP